MARSDIMLMLPKGYHQSSAQHQLPVHVVRFTYRSPHDRCLMMLSVTRLPAHRSCRAILELRQLRGARSSRRHRLVLFIISSLVIPLLFLLRLCFRFGRLRRHGCRRFHRLFLLLFCLLFCFAVSDRFVRSPLLLFLFLFLLLLNLSLALIRRCTPSPKFGRGTSCPASFNTCSIPGSACTSAAH